MRTSSIVLTKFKGQGPYPYSLQIQVEEVDTKYYVWDIFQGPSGVAVNPCGDTRFEKVYHGEPGWHTNKPDMDSPPYPQNYLPFVPEVSWLLSLDAHRTYTNSLLV